MSDYHNQSYWDARYKKDTEPFEWYLRFSELKPVIKEFIPEDASVLVLGAGSSELSFDLFDDAEIRVKKVLSIDFSQVIVDRMSGLIGDRAGCEYRLMNAEDLSGCSDNSYDVVIDKATLDTVVSGEGAREKATQIMNSVHRVLKPNGLYINVTYADKDMRMLYFNKPNLTWDIDIKVVPKPRLLDTNNASSEYYYVYILRKTANEEAEAPKKGAKK